MCCFHLSPALQTLNGRTRLSALMKSDTFSCLATTCSRQPGSHHRLLGLSVVTWQNTQTPTDQKMRVLKHKTCLGTFLIVRFEAEHNQFVFLPYSYLNEEVTTSGFADVRQQ